METADPAALSPAGANTYLLVVNGKPQGPYSISQLQAFKIKPDDFVRAPDMADYKEAHEIPELRELLGFSKQALIPQYFGSFDQRLMASALDWFFVSGACILVIFMVVLFINDAAVRMTAIFSFFVLAPLVNMVYHVVMECSAKQATYGKQVLKIKVCDMQGERISAARSLGRNLARFASVGTFFIGYLLSFFTRQQQCLHDIIAGTLVMKDRLF